jgi:hypothetical protein
MWLNLSEGLFYFGQGGVTVIKNIDLRDKTSSYVFKTELFCGASKIALVVETTEEIIRMMEEKKC